MREAYQSNISEDELLEIPSSDGPWWWSLWKRLTGVLGAILFLCSVCLYSLGCTHAGRVISRHEFETLISRTWKWSSKGGRPESYAYGKSQSKAPNSISGRVALRPLPGLCGDQSLRHQKTAGHARPDAGKTTKNRVRPGERHRSGVSPGG
jgi:hypothetical protein